MIKRKKIIYFFLSLVLIILFLIYFLKFVDHYPKNINLEYEKDFFGITFSKKYAEEIGLDWKETYLAILDELKVKQIRIPVYWDDIEKEVDVFDFSDYDFLIQEGSSRDVKFILNFGMRVARWPECHFPKWLDWENTEYLQERVLKMNNVLINHFKEYDNIIYWQLENEPLLNSFGICPKSDYNFLKLELEELKKIDDRPVIISATGELSFWNRESEVADILGTTMYRVVHNPFLGYIRYPYKSNFYSLKAKALNIDPQDVFIVELQAEPWIPKEDITNIYDLSYQKSFNIKQFQANAQFAIDTGFKKAYLWGAEWWYFKHNKGENSDYWNFAKELFK